MPGILLNKKKITSFRYMQSSNGYLTVTLSMCPPYQRQVPSNPNRHIHCAQLQHNGGCETGVSSIGACVWVSVEMHTHLDWSSVTMGLPSPEVSRYRCCPMTWFATYNTLKPGR